MYDIVVIGGGPAGITLAKRLGNKFKIAIIRPEAHSMIYCAMPYAIENIISTEKCCKSDNLITDNGADLIKAKVININFKNKKLELSTSKIIKYKKLIIASGANPFIPPIEGRSLQGVTGFKTASDLDKIISLVEKGLEKAVIVGAGAIGIELSQALKSKGLDVTLIDMESRVLPNLTDKDFSQKAYKELIKNGIDIKLNTRVEKLIGNTYINKVILNDGKKINFEKYSELTGKDNTTVRGLVAFATGMSPELSFIKSKDLKTSKGGIIVNDKMETNIPDVYAVGDCVDYKNFITGKICPGKLATNAVPMSKILADNLLGIDSSYKGFINGAATKVYNYYIGGTGLSETEAERNNIDYIKGVSHLTTQFPIMPDKKELSVKIIAKKSNHKIIGGQVLSGAPVTSIIDLISFAIQKDSTIEDLKYLSYSAQPYQSFFPASNAIVQAAENIEND